MYCGSPAKPTPFPMLPFGSGSSNPSPTQTVPTVAGVGPLTPFGMTHDHPVDHDSAALRAAYLDGVHASTNYAQRFSKGTADPSNHVDDAKHDQALMDIAAFGKNVGSLDDLRRKDFSIAQSRQAELLLEQQARAMQASCIGEDGSVDIGFLDAAFLQKLRQGLVPRPDGSVDQRTGGISCPVAAIQVEVACKIQN